MKKIGTRRINEIASADIYECEVCGKPTEWIQWLKEGSRAVCISCQNATTMKFAILSPDKEGRIDPPVHNILKCFPNLTEVEDADVVLVPITKLDNFVFNPYLFHLNKPVVLIDFCEYGWDWDRKFTHLFGLNTRNFGFTGVEWKVFDRWVLECNLIAYFKRELLKNGHNGRVHPIEYPCWQPVWPLESKEQFDARPLSVFNFWGRSHEGRLAFHGNVWRNAAQRGHAVCDNLYYFDEFLKREQNPNKWVSVNIPDYARVELKHILNINSLSKLSVSLPGAGVKCFRSTGESPLNSVMVMPEDDLAWSYPWVDTINCFKFATASVKEIGPEAISSIEYALERNDLYETYLMGHAHVNKYRIERYIPEYLIPIIEKAL